MHAFGISEEDVANVLRKNSARLTNVAGQSLDEMAGALLADIDGAAVERAALKGGVELEEQTEAAYEEIARQLVRQGVLEQMRSEPATAPVRKARP
jgi:hypothetical protein